MYRALVIRVWNAMRSHPLRTRMIGIGGSCAVLIFILRHWLWVHVPQWVSGISGPIFVAAQNHPGFWKVLHILINAVPDIAFLLLAIAGLAYLVPSRILKRIDELLWVRLVLFIVFCTFGLAAIIVNAVNRETEEYQKDQESKRMDLVLGDVTNIQSALSPKAASMTEVERHRRLLDSLRDEYVLEQKTVDPQILAGNKMPPDDWVNARLKEMGEAWKVNTVIPPSNSGSYVPPVSIGNITTQIPSKAGDDAVANVSISVNGRVSKEVNMGQLAAIYPESSDSNAQRGIENSLWGSLEDHDKKFGFIPLELPVNNKTLSMPIKQENVTQEQLDFVNSGSNEYYFMGHIEDMHGKTLLDVCFRVDKKNQVLYCREHNGP